MFVGWLLNIPATCERTSGMAKGIKEVLLLKVLSPELLKKNKRKYLGRCKGILPYKNFESWD